MARPGVRRELVSAARRGRTVTYGHLMKKFGIPRGRAGGKGITAVIGEIDGLEEAAKAPGFGPIIVRKDTGFPGGGFFCYGGIPEGLRRPVSRAQDPRLTEAEKEYVRKEQRLVWSFYGQARRGG
ncbi:MAG TPA: hypothetical protein VLY21_03810 [Nitrososphaerales archaeon]|nr:hypothetical protein [Nitrososphaerales archaeon]